MGIRTYIYGCEYTNIPAKTPTTSIRHDGVCLGKMVAYVDPRITPQMDTVKWLGEHLTDKEDREYLAQYYDYGYCGEYITFNQVFTHEEILEFVEAYYNDKVSKTGWNNVYGLSDVILLLENYDHFVIEWTGG